MSFLVAVRVWYCTEYDGIILGFWSEIMGCGASKVDDLPLVTLCKERKQLIKSAADHRFALAAAHIAYFRHLADVGESLFRFVEEELILSASSSSPSSPSSLSSPVVAIPSDVPKKNKTASSSTSVSHNLHEENSHLHLTSSDSSEVSSTSSHHHHDHRHHHDHVHNNIGHIEIEEEDEVDEYHEKVKKAPSPQPGISYIPHPSSSSNYTHPFDPNYHPPVNSYSNPYYPPMYPYNNPPYYSNYHPENNANLYGSSTSYTTYYMKKSYARISTVIYEEPKQNPIYSYSDYRDYPPNVDYPDRLPNVGAEYFGFMMNERGNSSRQVNQNQQQRPPPPPTPPSPKVSAWDYFNPFETYENGVGVYPGYYSQGRNGYGSNTSSPDSMEVREREGIPDLEEETESEVAKEPYKEKMKGPGEFDLPKRKNKRVQFNEGEEKTSNNKNNRDNFGEGTSKGVPMHKHREEPEQEPDQDPKPAEVREVKGSSPETETSISTSIEEVPIKKKGVTFEMDGASSRDIESSKPSSLTTFSAQGNHDLREVVREIKDEFEAAADYGKEVSVLLEVDKEPYRSRSTFLKVILARVCSTSLSSSIPPSSLASGYLGDPENDSNARSLASTLEKLYVWEKKLYKEVKDEERLRVMYEKQFKKLRTLDDQGAESSKVELVQASIKKLLTKINVSVRAVDSISSRIHKLRDEELQPQLKELIYGLRRMWKLMLKCHQKQFQAILESKTRALKANTGLRRDSSVRATIQLEAQLLKWCQCFNNWVVMQRSYAKTLNGWLRNCLHYEPEVTPDGIVPFSPGRIGAPPVFVLCHDWNQAMEGLSESQVQTAMNDFATSLHQLWERQDEEQRRRLKAENIYKDFEKQIHVLRTERQRPGLEHDKNDSLSMVASGDGVSPHDDLKVDLDSMRQRVKEERAGHKEAVKLVHGAVSRSIQAGLIPIFEALENFTSEASKAFDDVRLEHVGGRS